MAALLRFHLKVGVRVAIQSFTPLFCALLAWILLSMYPAELVKSLARSLFSPNPDSSTKLVLMGIAFSLAFWGAPRISHGLNGWLRHLPISSSANRCGALLALIALQMPLLVSLLLLGFVAHTQAITPFDPNLLGYALLFVSAASAALPVRRRVLSAAIAILSGLMALFGSTGIMLAGAAVLAASHGFCGPLRERRTRPNWSGAGESLDLRIAWRAVGWGILAPYLLAAIPLACTALFLENNDLERALAAGAARFGGGLSILTFTSSCAGWLAVRRPVWPWARSLPWSSLQRVGGDALFLGAHAVPLALLAAAVDPAALLPSLALLPILSIRASAHMRRLPGRRFGMGPFWLEGLFLSGSAALIAWAGYVWLAAALPAVYASAASERSLKATLWLEHHYSASGDSLSWTNQ